MPRMCRVHRITSRGLRQITFRGHRITIIRRSGLRRTFRGPATVRINRNSTRTMLRPSRRDRLTIRLDMLHRSIVLRPVRRNNK